MLSKEWKILNPKHQILNKFKYLNAKFKTNLSLKKKISTLSNYKR